MTVYASIIEGQAQETDYTSVHFPVLGSMAITYETNSWYEGKRPVLSLDFDEDIRVIDRFGNDVVIGQ